MIKRETLYEHAYEQEYMDRTKKHIELVNKYALKIGRAYPNHDHDKFGSLLEGYKLYSKPDKTEEEQKLLNDCTRQHIATNMHHPEYWSDVDLTKFSRENPTVCKAYTMPYNALREMCCDWAAMSEELGNTPFEWADKVINVRWFFTKEQVDYIMKTLEYLWNDKVG